MSLDFNQDVKSLDASYNNYHFKQLALNIMRHLTDVAQLEDFNPEAFDFVYNWNVLKRTVEIGSKAVVKQEIVLKNKHFTIKAGECFYLIKSKKFLRSEIEVLMRNNNFEIVDDFGEKVEDPKMRIIIAKKYNFLIIVRCSKRLGQLITHYIHFSI
jgi:uncharacterized SAM-dependent methyltransferase